MAGETEQVTAVMHELVDVHTIEHGGSALLYADKVDTENEQQPAEDCPGKISRTGIAMGLATGRDVAVAITKLLLFRVQLPVFNREKLQCFFIVS